MGKAASAVKVEVVIVADVCLVLVLVCVVCCFQ